MGFFILSLIVGGLVMMSIFWAANKFRYTYRPSLPPGPKGALFVGNINDLPKPGVLEAHHWLKHKEIYGS
jgi:hypothetical protein